MSMSEIDETLIIEPGMRDSIIKEDKHTDKPLMKVEKIDFLEDSLDGDDTIQIIKDQLDELV